MGRGGEKAEGWGEGRRGGRGHSAWALLAGAAWRGARREPREASGCGAEKPPLASQFPGLPFAPHPAPRSSWGACVLSRSAGMLALPPLTLCGPQPPTPP